MNTSPRTLSTAKLFNPAKTSHAFYANNRIFALRLQVRRALDAQYQNKQLPTEWQQHLDQKHSRCVTLFEAFIQLNTSTAVGHRFAASECARHCSVNRITTDLSKLVNVHMMFVVLAIASF
jgi:hypothetical protein